MATTVVKVIAADGSGDYLTVAAWVFARKGNLVVRDTIEVAEFKGVFSGSVSLNSADWTTDATRYIEWRAHASTRHAGKVAVGKSTIGSITGNVVDLHISDLLINAGAVGSDAVLLRGAKNYSVKRCIVYNCRYGVQSTTAVGQIIEVASSIIYCAAAAIYGNVAATWTVIGNTLIGGTYGIRQVTGTVVSNNNYLHGVTACYLNSGGLTKGANDATSNAEAITVALRNIAHDATTFIDVGAGTEDYHLVAASPLIDVGATDATCSPDIDDVARIAPYSIGADQYVALTVTCTSDPTISTVTVPGPVVTLGELACTAALTATTVAVPSPTATLGVATCVSNAVNTAIAVPSPVSIAGAITCTASYVSVTVGIQDVTASRNIICLASTVQVTITVGFASAFATICGASTIQVTVTLGSPGWTATATVCVTRQIQVAVDSGFPRPYETYPPPEDPIDEVWAGMVLLSGNATTTELIALGLTVLGSEFSAGPTKTWVRCGHAGILAMRENENMLRFPNRFFKVAVSEGTPSLSRIKQLWPHDYRRVVGAEILT